MKISATELKNRLGRYLDAAEQEPVSIQKSGREKAVLMSYSHYQSLLKASMHQPQTQPAQPQHQPQPPMSQPSSHSPERYL